MSNRAKIEEENFGILTDDQLALEATLVRPAGLEDQDVRNVLVWVPKYPLTRTSLLPAARYDAMTGAGGARSIQLAFDLRGTGESDGMPSTEGFEIDIRSIQEWAKERFGDEVGFEVFGFPDLGLADQLAAIPLRPGAMAELYRYQPDDVARGHVLYFSRYRDFGRQDDALCRALADENYVVLAGDPTRYILFTAPLTATELCHDGRVIIAQMGQPLYIIARSYAAGPALLLASQIKAVSGVIVTGPAQEGLDQPDLFSQKDLVSLSLDAQLFDLTPRPAVFLWNRAETGRLSPESLKRLQPLAGKATLWGVVSKVDAAMLLNALGWLEQNQPT